MMILSKLFTRRITWNPGEHLDADTLAAFSEHALSAHRRGVVFAHLAECQACREWLAAHSGLRDFGWSAANARKIHVFRLLPVDPFQVRVAAAIACALLLLAAISPNLFVKAPERLPTMRPSELLASKHPIARNDPSLPLVKTFKSRASSEDQPSRHYSRKALDRIRLASWRTAWIQPVLLRTSMFSGPQQPLPGPLGQAKLIRNLNFAANFSIEEAMLPSLNQIAVRTSLGERLITLDRLSSATWARF